ncbi:uncharacterized protein LOC129761281 [Toxorhynchites rutilus septentrionalis]|uniref:uncharacterized protein LOC129761281 n=1 Tax=Toxorhynchites rutilus septentrionalis TaxID=329112 RepID=UPI002479D314|nr:uncharacterized protein LOC129761281 [Toxorhynchites rutilus septentrionalis]
MYPASHISSNHQSLYNRDAINNVPWELSTTPTQSCHTPDFIHLGLTLAVQVIPVLWSDVGGESPNLTLQLDDELRLLGRTINGIMEAPNPSNSVEPCSQRQISRPGPVVESGEGVFQRATLGEYDSIEHHSQPDLPLISRGNDTTSNVMWLYYQNVRGLRTKIDDLYVAVCDCNYDVIMLTESGLDDSINSIQLFGAEFNVFRCDRSPSNSSKSRFGGVLIAVARHFSAVSVQTRNGNSLEQICVSTTIRGKRILLCAVYIPPDRSRDVGVYDSHLASVRELCDRASSDDTVLVCGDYNQPHIAWELHANSVVDLNPSLTSAASAVLLDGITFLGLQQRNFIRNFRGRTLDLVFCAPDINIAINESVSPLLAVDLHHPPLVLSLSDTRGAVLAVEDRNEGEQALNYAKINFAAFNEFLSSYNWNALGQDVNDMATRFCEIVCSWLVTNTPRRKPPMSPAWSTPLLRILRRDKNSCQRKLRRRRTVETIHNFQLASSVYRRLNRALYKSYVLRVQTNLRRNPKSFWKFVNSKRKTADIPSKVFSGAQESSSVSEMCDLFSKHFASVFVAEAATPSEAERAAANIPESLIDLGPFVVTPQMVEKGKGDKCNVANYRGITSLSVASKLFELIVNDAVFFKVKRYISPVQHGFMPGRSVSTNLLEFSSFCINRLEERAQVDAIYTDIKAAFDRIDHRILLRKLSRLGASDEFINWLRSYLSGRTLRVKLLSHTSSPFAVSSGVPQGSNLGPLLFAIFYNDVSLILACDCVSIYADDLKIYLAIETLEDCRRLQSLLDQFTTNYIRLHDR